MGHVNRHSLSRKYSKDGLPHVKQLTLEPPLHVRHDAWQSVQTLEGLVFPYWPAGQDVSQVCVTKLEVTSRNLGDAQLEQPVIKLLKQSWQVEWQVSHKLFARFSK